MKQSDQRQHFNPDKAAPGVCPGCFADVCVCGPYVCPGCQSIVLEPCPPWCPESHEHRSRYERPISEADLQKIQRLASLNQLMLPENLRE